MTREIGTSLFVRFFYSFQFISLLFKIVDAIIFQIVSGRRLESEYEPNKYRMRCMK